MEEPRAHPPPPWPSQHSPPPGARAELGLGPSPPLSSPGDWKCSLCTNINFVFRDRCNRCASPRPIVNPSSLAPEVFNQYAPAENQLICPFTVHPSNSHFSRHALLFATERVC